MLETLREYAAEQLELHGGTNVLADRHADYFIALGEGATRGAPDQDVDRGRRLYSELDNFRRAREWLVSSGDVQRELRLATHAFWCLWTHANLRELHGWLVSALERAAEVSPALRGDALGAAALAAANLGETEVARRHAHDSLALARERDDKRQIEWALRVLSFDEPDLAERRRLLDDCERLSRELGNEAGLGWVAYLRGLAFMDEGRLDQAREMLEQAAALFRKLGRRWEATNADISVAYTLLAGDRHAEARVLLEKALADAVALTSTASIVEALVLLAALRVDDDPAAATRLLAAVQAIADQHGHELDPDSRADSSSRPCGLHANTSDSSSTPSSQPDRPSRWRRRSTWLSGKGDLRDGEGRDRTSDTAIFSRVLYQLSYLAAAGILSARKRTASGTVLPLLGGRSTTPDSTTPGPPGQEIRPCRLGENSTPISSPASVAVSSAALPWFTATDTSPDESL